MKNKLFSIILIMMLSLPISVSAVDDNLPNSIQEPDNYAEEVVTDETTVEPAEPAAVSEAPIDNTYKKPISKKKIAKKFLLAMFCVGMSSFLIYFALTIYNRVRGRLKGEVKTPVGETSLQTPYDTESAVRTFIEKTDWKD